jgi:hypothetical protein
MALYREQTFASPAFRIVQCIAGAVRQLDRAAAPATAVCTSHASQEPARMPANLTAHAPKAAMHSP